MRVELTEMLWLEEHELSSSELAALSGLSPELLGELVRCGAVAPLDESVPEPRFGAAALRTVRTARRLQDELELDAPALMFALGLLDRIDALEAQLRQLRAKLPGPRR